MSFNRIISAAVISAGLVAALPAFAAETSEGFAARIQEAQVLVNSGDHIVLGASSVSTDTLKGHLAVARGLASQGRLADAEAYVDFVRRQVGLDREAASGLSAPKAEFISLVDPASAFDGADTVPAGRSGGHQLAAVPSVDAVNLITLSPLD